MSLDLHTNVRNVTLLCLLFPAVIERVSGDVDEYMKYS